MNGREQIKNNHNNTNNKIQFVQLKIMFLICSTLFMKHKFKQNSNF